ncbi:MAG: hypothetical protein HRT45_06460 [Bdellovibrionales bacterium]|nr:hypothetical protein [Bdellovibrionales bacterium]
MHRRSPQRLKSLRNSTLRKTSLIKLMAFAIGLMISLDAGANSWDDFFDAAKLKREDVEFKSHDMSLFGGASHVSPHFKNLMLNPLGTPSYFQVTKNQLNAKQNEVDHLLIQTLAKQGLGIRRNLVGNSTAAYKALSEKRYALRDAIAKLYSLKSKKLTAKEKSDIQHFEDQGSRSFNESLAYLVYVVHASQLQRNKSLKAIKGSRLKILVAEILKEQRYSEDIFKPLSPAIRQAAEQTDMKALAVGAIDMAIAIQKIKGKMSELGSEIEQVLKLKTPFGWLILDTRKKSSTHMGPFFFVVDTHGDDTYIAQPGQLGAPEVILDLKGNDKYIYEKALAKTSVQKFDKRSDQSTRSFGSGFFSYSFLVDFEGNDLYRSTSLSQGAGMFGVGVLWDLRGDDTYDCYNFCQAAAKFGAGLLIDNQGANQHFVFREGQAFASTLGAAALLNFGNEPDNYIAHRTPTDYPAYYDKTVNSSFAQGAALGFRADYIDGNSAAGGFALLLDGGGNNKFEAGFYAQGTAYWYGVGALLSGSGDDEYLSSKYSLGSGVHFGVGFVDDSGGDDQYQVKQELGIAAGHDFSLGFLIDHAGNDRYWAVNLSFGCGSANGIGLFWDIRGKDEYTMTGKEGFGCASDRTSRHSIRNRNQTLGFFLDSKGRDSVNAEDTKINGEHRRKSWVNGPIKTPKPAFTKPYYIGIGRFSQRPPKVFPDGFPLVKDEQ